VSSRKEYVPFLSVVSVMLVGDCAGTSRSMVPTPYCPEYDPKSPDTRRGYRYRNNTLFWSLMFVEVCWRYFCALSSKYFLRT
jgi:hypothetical protein